MNQETNSKQTLDNRYNPMNTQTIKISFTCLALLASAACLRAATIIKSGNTDNLNLTTSWVGGVVPGALDAAKWDSTVTSPNSVALGANMSLGGIIITSPGGAVTITGNTLTTGNSGIDMSGASQNLTISSGLTLGPGAQTWGVANGMTLTVNGTFTRSAGSTLVTGSSPVAAASQGTVTCSPSLVNNVLPWATVLSSGTPANGTAAGYNFATVTGGNIDAYTGATSETTAGAGVFFGGIPAGDNSTVNYDLGVGSTGGSLGSDLYVNTLRNTGGAYSQPGTANFRCNGLMNAGSGFLVISTPMQQADTSLNEIVLTAWSAGITLNGRISDNVNPLRLTLTGASSQSILLATNANTFSGGVTINSVLVPIRANSIPTSGTVTSGPLGRGAVTLNNGGTLFATGGGYAIGNPIVVGTGGGRLQLNGASPDLTINGNVSGSGTLTLSGVYNQNGLFLNGDDSAFSGTVIVNGSNNRLGTSASGSAQARWVVNGALQAQLVGGGTYQLGELSGSSDGGLCGHAANTTSGTQNFVVGALNTSSTYSGIIANNASGNPQTGNTDSAANNVLALTKVGTGTLTLSGTNSNTGNTVVSNGTLLVNGSIASTATVASGAKLGGNGTIGGVVTVQAGGQLGAGTTTSIGTLTLSSAPVLGGSVLAKLSAATGQADLIKVTGVISYGGSLVAGNIGVPLLAGDMFTIFTATTHSGSFNSIVGSPGPGLAYSFTNGVLSVVSTVVTSYPTNISATLSRDPSSHAKILTIAWPSTHSGWALQVQTNNVDGSLINNSAAWSDLPGSDSVNVLSLTNLPDRAMYFRLKNATHALPAAPPTILTATAGNATVSLSWTAPAYARSYNVKRATTSGGPYTTITNVTTTSLLDTNVVNGTTYYYVVSALNYNGETANSAQANATPTAPPPPAAPINLTATAGNAVVLLGWTASAGATSYNVKRSTTSGGPYTTITNVTTTSLLDTNVVNGTTYYYVVSALNAYGESVNSSQASATPAALPPAAPIGLTATSCDAQVLFSWASSLGATSYKVKRATTSGGPYTTITTVSSTSFLDTGLVDGTTYYYVVSALNASGESPNSSEKSATPRVVPFVYSVENTGTNCAAPPLPPVPPPGSFTFIEPFPDPFTWANDPLNINGTRSTDFTDWKCHRAQIKAQIEKYEIGTKPVVDPTNIFASYSSTIPNVSGTLTVRVTNNNQTLTLTCAIMIPLTATAPYPIVIGMNSANGSLPAQDFLTRGIATCQFSHDQVTTYNSPANSNPYYVLYGPALNVDNTGQYSAWAWGVSRIIDGLQMVTNTLPVDLKHICVTGCSYAGKMALFSGAFDERVALTVAQESGGGGDTAWRYSRTEPVGTVEGLDQTSSQWFAKQMFQFGGTSVSYLPEDHHELMAMCAPRALYCTANTDYVWLSNPSAYVCGMACARVYETFCIGDRFGFNVDGGHQHCTFPQDQESDLGYFLDKFMKGQTNLSQTIRTAPTNYSTINFARWTTWWGTTNAVLPP